MTARTMTLEGGAGRTSSSPLLGFRTALRKESSEWLRSPKGLIVTGVSIVGAVFMTLIPFIAKATNDAQEAGILSRDPTANVLMSLAGQTVAIIAILATMATISQERDRGTLAWSLSNPVSPTAILAAKALVAFVVLGVTTVILPVVVSFALASVVYGPPDVGVVARYAALYLSVPAFYVALTVALGSGIRTTVGVAGAAIAVMVILPGVGQLVPVINEVSPTSMATWALAAATGQTASALTPIGWAVALVIIALVGMRVFDRQEV